MEPAESDDDILIEFTRLGRVVKATAIDQRTLAEASIVGPASAGEHALARAAVARLRWAEGRSRRG
jgi:hypothetical protein